jgi:hypothetical protein
MGANAQTKVPTFASAEVLTAANQNLLSNGIPVFSGTATRNDAFGGSGEKVLAEGQFAFLEDSNSTQFYDGAAWQNMGGLNLLSTTTLSGASTTVTISDFSYLNLFVLVTGMTNLTASSTAVCKINNLANNVYGVQTFNANGTSGTAAITNSSLDFLTSSTFNNANNVWQIVIGDYASSTTVKSLNYVAGAVRSAGGNSGGTFSGYVTATTQISSLVFSNSGGNWNAGTVTVYGVK